MYAYIFLFGIVVGSFCNVCILRIPKGESIISGRSHCTSCNKQLKWWELVPLFSWILLRGKCSSCKAKISAQYPLIELVNGILWVVIFACKGLTIDMLLGCMLFSALLVMSVIDGRTKEIPPVLSIFIFGLGLARALLYFNQIQGHLLGLVSVAGVLFLLFFLSKGAAIGGGDVKLMAGCGLFLGLGPVVLSFLLACVIGSTIHLIRMFFFKAGRELAMGPYLAVGVCISYLYGQQMIDSYMNLLGI